MKHIGSSLLLIACTVFFTVLFHGSDQLFESSSISTNGYLNQKLAPSDRFDMMHSYPDLVPDYKGIDQAMNMAHQMRFQASRSNGFGQQWRTEGPGNIGARINTIAVPEGQADTMYIGYARGGIYRTYDGGVNWTSIFDDQPRLCIGDIAINPLDPQVLFAGTGDRNINGLFSTGTGIYKSYDGGDTWLDKGLDDQYVVSAIRINPLDTSIIYAACMGLPSLPDTNRGLYKSEDGGDSWTRVLFVGDSAGINDVVMHPTNPDILYASGWNRTRTNQVSVISGNAARIWKTIDGGDNWTMLGNGLPTGPQGRVGLSMFTPNPDTLYALYVGTDAQLEGIYRTFDGGANWTTMPTVASGVSTNALGGFGWYFSGISVNPYDYEDVFFNGVQLWRTQNSGTSWATADPPWWTYEVHADKHDMVFLGPDDYLLATDGGLYRTFDAGNNWLKIEEIKTNQFYRVTHTHLDPQNYYGGMQDNGTSGGNYQLAIWPRIFGGDGFQVRFHESNSSIFYVETQNGNINYTDDGGFNFSSIGFPDDNDRTNWDTPYMLSYHDASTLYAGSYRVWRQDVAPYGGWTLLSGDLTDGNIFGSGFHTISGLDESSLNANRLYVCTTDGNVWRTVNGGTSWDPIQTGLPDRYVTSVKASPTNADHVFVTHSGYKYNDFFAHIHKSIDNGDNWIDISGDMPPVAVNDIVIYPNHDDSVLFVATDAGVYGTIDGGLDWQRLGTNMPMVAVHDLDIDTVNNRLVAATFGKSIMTYLLDSLVVPGTTDTLIVGFDLFFAETDMTCNSTGNGAINLSVFGGLPPYTYAWSNGATTEDLEDLASGTYTVTVTDANAEVSIGSDVVVYNPIHPDPVVGPINGATQASAWAEFNYDVPATGGSVFEWSVSGGTIQMTASNAMLVLWEAGPSANVVVSETDMNGCRAADSIDVLLDFVGIEEAKDQEVLIYPNPASDHLQLKLGSSAQNVKTRILDVQGRVVYEGMFSGSVFRVDLSSISAGAYFIEIEADVTGISTHGFSIQR